MTTVECNACKATISDLNTTKTADGVLICYQCFIKATLYAQESHISFQRYLDMAKETSAYMSHTGMLILKIRKWAQKQHLPLDVVVRLEADMEEVYAICKYQKIRPCLTVAEHDNVVQAMLNSQLFEGIAEEALHDNFTSGRDECKEMYWDLKNRDFVLEEELEVVTGE